MLSDLDFMTFNSLLVLVDQISLLVHVLFDIKFHLLCVFKTLPQSKAQNADLDLQLSHFAVILSAFLLWV